MLLIILLATDARGFAVVQAKDLSISCRNPSFKTSNGISSLLGSAAGAAPFLLAASNCSFALTFLPFCTSFFVRWNEPPVFKPACRIF
jgi:hypothetical protein